MTEYKELEEGLKKLKQELAVHKQLKENSNHSTANQDRFLDTMIEFQAGATEQFSKVQAICQEMCVAYDKAVRYFGENPEKMLPDAFFGILSRFRTSWQVIIALRRRTLLDMIT
jgi:hypothetical protein